MGLPPTPTPITKRRYDPQILQRPGVSQSELMDVDDPVAGSQASMAASHAPPTQFSQASRFMTPGQQTSTPQSRVLSNPIQAAGSPVPGKLTHSSQARSNPPPGPKMGFFSEPSLERRPTMPSLPPSRTGQQGLHMHSQQQRQQQQQQQQESSPQDRLPQEGSVPSLEFMENLEREKARAMSIQAQAFQPQDRAAQSSPHASVYNPLGLPNPRSTQPVSQDRRTELDDRPSTPGLPAPAIPRPGQSMFRNMLGSPAPSAPSSLTLNPSFRPSTMPSPPKREDHRPGSVPAPSPASNPRSLAAPPAEPRKTSNVMSLLNDEPAEPRPAKPRSGEQSSSSLYSRAQSPAPQSFGTSAMQPDYAPRRDMFSSTPVHRMDFERAHYAQPVPHAPTSSSQHERLSGGSLTTGGSRQDWGPRASISQSPLSSSPQPQTPLTSEARPFFSHHHRTSVLSGLNAQSRHNPSPPPNNNHYLHHSRTPSLSQVTPASGQTHSLQHVHQSQTQGPQHVASSQANPYAPTSGPSPLQYVQAQQQNQLRHAHNGSIGPGMQRRHVEEDYTTQRERDFRREDQIRQERMDNERQHMDRQILDKQAREQDAQQYHAQMREREQIYGHQYRQAAPLAQQARAPSYSSQAMGSTLREQSAKDASASFRDAMNREDQIRMRTQPPDVREYEAVVEQRRRQEQEERYQQEERYRHEQMRDGGYSGGRLSGDYSGRR